MILQTGHQFAFNDRIRLFAGILYQVSCYNVKFGISPDRFDNRELTVEFILKIFAYLFYIHRFIKLHLVTPPSFEFNSLVKSIEVRGDAQSKHYKRDRIGYLAKFDEFKICILEYAFTQRCIILQVFFLTGKPFCYPTADEDTAEQ